MSSTQSLLLRHTLLGLIAAAIFARLVLSSSALGLPAYAKAGDWPTYMARNGRSGFNEAETMINPISAPHLKVHWKMQAAGRVTTQPVVANGLIYWGSWDGLEHATNPSTGADTWTANLGQSTSRCSKAHHGVLSSAAVASVLIGGVSTPVVFVGGGDVTLYALDATTGAVIWKTTLGSVPDAFLYGSPAVYQGSVYIGVASHGDCPLIQGQLVQLKASTGKREHTFDVVPHGCLGGGIWVAPTIDAATSMLYVGTGNGGTCATSENLAPALVELRASDLSLVASWQVPPSQQTKDSDFGSTATLFTATIGGVVHRMIGLLNKNGIYYAFDRSTISAGPLWQVPLAAPAANGENNVSSAAWDGTILYAAAASTQINGTTCAGSLRALDPASGNVLWADCFTADIFGPVTAVPGLAEVGVGTSLVLAATTTGSPLFSFQDASANSQFEGSGTISNGVLYHGNTDGYLYAIGP